MTEFSFPPQDIKAVNPAEARSLFEQANHFWFEEGCYHLVLPLYLEALKYDSTDPVMLYQLAVVLRAFERFDEAALALEMASLHQILLSKIGRQLLDRRKKWLLKHLYNAPPLPIPAIEIDIKQFLSKSFHYNEWLEIAIAASEHRMFLLAAIAYDRSLPFSESQKTWEAEQARLNNQSDIAILNALRPSARQLFEKANHFWFKEGRYHLVLPIYQEALKYDPTDPVMLYQLAVVLRAFERFDEAVQALDLASLHQNRLSEKGRELFARRKEWLLRRPSYGWLPIPAWEIDLKKLIADNPSPDGWYSISQVAEERRMFLLAFEAYYMHLTYADSETMREAEQVGSQNERDRWVLKGMRD
ncbi:tetratricopeptide repeat protein [Microcoleus sp. herbarium8]|uniref:tetratricopeptide repeat protein n=1 Tax=Microcoleus sp. herbarium8 TaxID=3055436 RepID=UPI002FCF3B7F